MSAVAITSFTVASGANSNVAVPLMLAGVSPRERHARVTQTLAEYGLSERAHHRPDQLSGGQRQRVAIARATIMRPHVILADEPTGNLDSVSGRQVIEVLEHLNEAGVTLIIVTHDLDIGRRARRRLRIVDGRIHSQHTEPTS